MRKPPKVPIPDVKESSGGMWSSPGAVFGTIALFTISAFTGGIGILAVLVGFVIMVLADAWFGVKTERVRKIDADRVTRYSAEHRRR